MITGSGSERRLRIAAAEGRPPSRSLPVGIDLLDRADASAFGVEERCTVREAGGGLDLVCRPGSAPAGIMLRLDGHFPRGAQAAGRLQAQGTPGFAAQFILPGADADRPVPVGAELPLPAAADGAGQLVVLAPRDGGSLHISGLTLQPAHPPDAATAGAWAWEPELWRRRGDRLIRAAGERRLDRLYVTLAIEGGRVRHRAELVRFIRAARAAGLSVEAVEGDPEMVSPDGLASARRRARAIARYQRDAPPEARLTGLQYDVEPYVSDSWTGGPADYRRWADAVRALSSAAGGAVHVVLPFWIADGPAGRTFLGDIAGAISGLTVMAYRTDPAEIAAAAEPLLSWGAANGLPVRVALEAGPVAAESEERFGPAATGKLALVQSPGGTSAVLLAREAALAGARMFASAGVETAQPRRISFLGDDAGMIAAARRLLPSLCAWPSFAGLSYHGLDWSGGEGRPIGD